MKRLILMIPLLLATTFNVTSCANIQPLEQMNELEYENWKVYIQLGVKVAANRLLQEGTISESELVTMADVIDTVTTSTVLPGATSILSSAIEQAGLTSDEARLLVAIVERELLARGALDWVDPATGTASLSPRTKEILGIVSVSLRSAKAVTPTENAQAQVLEAQFRGNLVTN